MAFFFHPADGKRAQLTSIEVMSDGFVEFAVWHDGSENSEVRLQPNTSRGAFSESSGEPIDMFAKRYALFGSSGAKTAQFFLLSPAPRPFSTLLEIKTVSARTLTAPPTEKQATRMQCWAAALSAWKQVTGVSANRSTQAELVQKYSDIPNGGCSESRLRDVLVSLGFSSKGFASFALKDWPLADIANELSNQKYPVLVFKSSQLNSHTVVVYGLYSPDGGRPVLQIMDPWTGTLEELPLTSLVGRSALIANHP